jgi:GTP pyrophosphokinase
MGILIEKLGRYSDEEINKQKILDAYHYVEQIYADTDLDIYDVLEVLDSFIELKPGEETIVSIFLYELYLYSFITRETILEKFGSNVVELLDRIVKLAKFTYLEAKKNSKIEVLRQMFLTIAKDSRVILIWLAIRLKDMKRLEHKDEAMQLRISEETMKIHVPIAARLGVYRLKTGLEDLAFQYLNKEHFEEISHQIKQYGDKTMIVMQLMEEKMRAFLQEAGIKAHVTSRIKSAYSIFKKLKKKGLSRVDDLYDFFAIRIVLPTKYDQRTGIQLIDHLYIVLGMLHAKWSPLSRKFKDYIAVPKPNGYRSLHTILLDVLDEESAVAHPVEVQIRDEEMHREADYGSASHWLYKKLGANSKVLLERKSEWMKQIQRFSDVFAESKDLTQGMNLDIFEDSIFVLTPKGDVKDLPNGATTLDFAYSVHTDVGNKCAAAKVNSKLVPLHYTLRNGDVVEIVTRESVVPRAKWLSMVITSFAKNKIKNYLNSQNKKEHFKLGKKLINDELKQLAKPQLNNNLTALKAFSTKALSLTDREAIVEEVGRGVKLASDVVRKLFPDECRQRSRRLARSRATTNNVSYSEEELHSVLLIGGEKGMPVKFSKCCKPSFGNDVLGYITKMGVVSIHRRECRFAKNLNTARVMDANWT